jgi:hypothetical protein
LSAGFSVTWEDVPLYPRETGRYLFQELKFIQLLITFPFLFIFSASQPTGDSPNLAVSVRDKAAALQARIAQEQASTRQARREPIYETIHDEVSFLGQQYTWRAADEVRR